MKAGSIVKNASKLVYVFGVAEVDNNGFISSTGIGINLNTGLVDDIEDFLVSDVKLEDLSEKQLKVLTKAIQYKMTLANAVAISGKARAGKDTLANEILETFEGDTIIHALGDSIKEIAHVLYGNYEGKNRKVLIMIGQGLRQQDPHIWIKTWLRIAINDMEVYGFARFVVPDVRQPNEFTFFKSLGALTVRIDVDENKRLEVIGNVDGRQALDSKLLNDETESHVATFDTDVVVTNDYTDNFKKEVAESVIEKIKDEGELV